MGLRDILLSIELLLPQAQVREAYARSRLGCILRNTYYLQVSYNIFDISIFSTSQTSIHKHQTKMAAARARVGGGSPRAIGNVVGAQSSVNN
jgi:hypothetical protein